jgi:hypothetical protein
MPYRRVIFSCLEFKEEQTWVHGRIGRHVCHGGVDCLKKDLKKKVYGRARLQGHGVVFRKSNKKKESVGQGTQANIVNDFQTCNTILNWNFG